MDPVLKALVAAKWLLKTAKVRISNVRLLELYQSRGAVGHAPADNHRRVKGQVMWHFYERPGLVIAHLSSLEWGRGSGRHPPTLRVGSNRQLQLP